MQRGGTDKLVCRCFTASERARTKRVCACHPPGNGFTECLRSGGVQQRRNLLPSSTLPASAAVRSTGSQPRQGQPKVARMIPAPCQHWRRARYGLTFCPAAWTWSVYKKPISRTAETPSGWPTSFRGGGHDDPPGYVGGWPTSFRGGGHDDPPGYVGPCRLMQPPRSENVGHPQGDSALFIHALRPCWGASRGSRSTAARGWR